MFEGFLEEYRVKLIPLVDLLTGEKLAYMRTEAIGGASVSLGILFIISQVSVKTVSLNISLYAILFALPAWVAAWHCVGHYIFHGEGSFSHFGTVQGSGLVALLGLVGGVSVFISVASLIWYLSVCASVVFIVFSLLAIILVNYHASAVRNHLE